ncbi:hypothetical protein [Streptomyces sp. NBC_01614]|uniref:hypothetical protein n=1 Tax=Streptomyces sp. NBC_01614 TaxID=2975897 RepID=UPI00386FDC8E
MIRGTGGRWLVAALTASAVFTSGCTDSVDTDELPGVYRNEATGGKLQLESDGTFSATGVSTDRSSGSADFSGRWEFVDSQGAGDFIYLTVEDGGLGRTGGVQLWPKGPKSVYFQDDPDEPPALVLTKASTP